MRANIRLIVLFVAQVILMAYMCLIQLLPRKARRFVPLGKYTVLSTEKHLRDKPKVDVSGRVAIVTGANSGVGSVCPL